MNYWSDYERVISVLKPVRKVLKEVRGFDPQGSSNFAKFNSMRILKEFIYIRNKFDDYVSTGDYMAQLLLLTNTRWSGKLRCSHLLLDMKPTILGIAPNMSGDVVLRMPVLSRYQMLSNLLFRAKRDRSYSCVAVLHKDGEIFSGARWSNTPHGWIYPGAAARELLDGLSTRWQNMANFIDEKEMEEIILPHEVIWLVQRCFQEHKIRRSLAKCERILVRKLAEMVFGENCGVKSQPLVAPQSARLDDGSLITLGLSSVFTAKISSLSDMQLSLFNNFKISAALPSVKWHLHMSGPHAVSREKLLLDKAC